ncbi:MAG TPA: hypothetical protein VIU38_06555 [Anaerolineales bacterium]
MARAGIRLILLALAALQVVAACSLPLRVPDGRATETFTATDLTAEAPASPTALPPSPGCYYSWATRELPGLGQILRARLQPLGDGIRESAYAFGEDCRHDDGTVDFLTMEADFRVQVPVADSSDERELGKWIADVMSAIDSIPASDVPGSRPGRVEFEFKAVGGESRRLTIDISRYRAEAQGLEGAELYKHFSAPP